LGRLIRVATCGGVNHVAICGLHPQTGKVIVYESTMSHPDSLVCIVTGRPVKGVQAHNLFWRLRYEARCGGSVWHYPLKRPLIRFDDAHRLTDFCRSKLGTPYDYWGAVWARSICFGWLAHRLSYYHGLSRECDGRLFCSEFVAMALREADRFHTANASVWNPAQLIKTAYRIRGVFADPIQVVPP
jgi:hypothetical protein